MKTVEEMAKEVYEQMKEMFKEDTGLSFDDICKLVYEYKHERLIELPCKVGDTLYKIHSFFTGRIIFVRPIVLTWSNLKEILDHYGIIIFSTKGEAQRVANEIKSWFKR